MYITTDENHITISTGDIDVTIRKSELESAIVEDIDEKLQQKLGDYSTKISDLEEEVEELKAEISELNTQVAAEKPQKWEKKFKPKEGCMYLAIIDNKPMILYYKNSRFHTADKTYVNSFDIDKALLLPNEDEVIKEKYFFDVVVK